MPDMVTAYGPDGRAVNVPAAWLTEEGTKFTTTPPAETSCCGGPTPTPTTGVKPKKEKN